MSRTHRIEMHTDHRAENELLLCVARRALDQHATQRLQQLVRDELDWGYVRSAAREHLVLALLYRHLNSVCPQQVPAEIMSELRTDYRENRRSSVFLSAEM